MATLARRAAAIAFGTGALGGVLAVGRRVGGGCVTGGSVVGTRCHVGRLGLVSGNWAPERNIMGKSRNCTTAWNPSIFFMRDAMNTPKLVSANAIRKQTRITFSTSMGVSATPTIGAKTSM